MPPNPLPIDERWMRRALELATGGRGRVEPNPMVGCVIVRDDQLLGEGWHQSFGGPHAEIEALRNCVQSPAGATAYVTLEPCCHQNKKTPPCAPALIAARLARVVVGCVDPNPKVSGQGIAQLRSAGIDVAVGVLEPECRQMNAAFVAGILHQRPYVTLKWAQTADGKVAGPTGARLQISNPASMKIVHELRARCDAIMVGIGTVLADDPLLLARHVENPRPLLRVVLDKHLRTPLHSQLVSTAGRSPVLLLCSRPDPAKAAALSAHGVEVLDLPDPSGQVSLPAALQELARRDVTHLLVEPGPTLARAFLEQNQADRAWIFQSPQRLDNPTAPSAAELTYKPIARREIAGDALTEYLNVRSKVFFAAKPSADLRLINIPDPK